MKNNKIISVFATAALVFNMLIPFTVSKEAVAADATVYLNEGFGSYVTNEREPAGWTVKNLASFSIVEADSRDKVAKFEENGRVSIEKSFGTNISNNSVVSVSLKPYGGVQPNLKVNLMSGTAATELFSVQNGVVYLRANNKSVGKVSATGVTKIDAILDLKYGYIDIYVNGSCVLSKWSMTSIKSTFNGIRFEQGGSEGFGITATAVYDGTAINDQISDASFNPDKKSSFYIEQDGSDMTYFNSTYISNYYLTYPLTTMEAKEGNSVEAKALKNWKNPNKEDEIILTKGDSTNGTDAYFNVDVWKRGAYFPDPDKKYKYYMLTGDFMYTDNVSGQLLYVRDETSGTKYQYFFRLFEGGLYTHDWELLKQLSPNKYYHLELYMDLESHVMDVYLDGEIIGQDVAILDTINVLSFYRCSIDHGLGSLTLDNWEFRGLAKRYGRGYDENGKAVPVVINSSQFPDNETIKTYLADKIVFHGDGQMYYKAGEKIPFTKEAVYENSDLYVAPEDFNAAYGTSIKYDESSGTYKDGSNVYSAAAPITRNGTVLYPAKSLSLAYGWGAKNNGYGSMVIAAQDLYEIVDTSEQDMPWFDTIYYMEGSLDSATMRFTDAQEISNYVFYDRPDAAEIQEDFKNTLGENPQHPRLMVNSEDVSRLRGLVETDCYFKNLADGLTNYVDTNLLKRPLINYGDSYGYTEMGKGDDGRTLVQAFSFWDMEKVACAYIVTGDTKYSDKAITMLMNVVDTFPDLNPAHIIDTGSWLRTIAIIYDWCYDQMTDEQREKTAAFIMEKGLTPINKAYYAHITATMYGDLNSFQTASWFPTWKSNYTSYTQGGAVMGALAVAEDYPELAFDTLEKGLRAYEYEHFGFYPGGIWLEGKVYQQVINKNNAYAFGSMLKCLGTDYNVLEYKGIHESLTAMMSYSSLNGAFTFGDDTERYAMGGIDDSYQFFANYYKDPVLSMWRQLKLDTKYAKQYNNLTPENAGVLDIIYYEPMAGDSVLQDFNKVNYFEGGEIYTLHENWLDKNATFFAAAGGPTLHYHRHYDAGDFYYENNGTRWTYEFGQGNYNVGSIWSRFGGRSEAHNTITINNSEGVSMKESSFVPVIAQGEGTGGAYVVYDMKELYAQHGTEKMHRGFYIGDDYDSLRIRDEMSFSEKVTGYWHFHTDADVSKIDDTTMLLSKDNKTMLLHINIEGSGFETEFSVGKARPLPESPVVAGDTSAETDINQVRIKFVGTGDINITVELYDKLRDIDTTPISQWTAPEMSLSTLDSGNDFSYDLYANGEKIDSQSVIPVINGVFNDFEVVPRSSNVKAEVVGEAAKKLEEPILVKLTTNDGAYSVYTMVKYSKYGEAVKNILYNDLDIASYEVSSEPEPQNGRENMFDNNPDTRFCMYYDNATVTMDLGEIKPVDGISLIVWKGNQRTYYFDVQTSTDGVNFKTVGEYSSSGEVEDYEFYTFPTEQARYVRFVGHMHSAGDTNNINELRVIQKK